jgi:hypothetical protein
MTKVGILVHCRHLETIAWEELVFGIPEQDRLGDLSTLARVILSLEPSEELASIVIGCGPSWKDGLNEGDYTKQFLLDNFDRLHEFPRLAPLIENLNDEQLQGFRTALEAIIVTHEPCFSLHKRAGCCPFAWRHRQKSTMANRRYRDVL